MHIVQDYKDKANFSFMENRQCNGSHQIINEEGRYVTSHLGN